ncbi:beta strand repeat-containing protein [Nocardioides pocheonensis]|uniref:Ig-like domain repeat protein n=1 Tax=Nocardioides pocheonensis TaxID=661485 RepID=A0A3N0GXU6_9ACTN|nr:Ig-like domain-containing protein [Nocardioides pocheonensis]RNM17305.1 Ig-like domain repeat protein [Nocardioides pocheonensis]
MSDHMKRDATPGLLGRLIRRGRRDARRTSVALAVVTGFVALTTGIAFAFWSSTGTGTATASTGTLSAPTGTTASTTAGSGAVSVSWNAPTTGVAPSGYTVSRVLGGSSVSVCGTGTILVTGTSCSDTSVPDGTYTYVVTSIRGGWTAAGTASAPVTVTNTIATTTSVTSSANPAVVGQTVTYTATVTQATGATKPTGSVTFKDGSSTITCTGGNQTLSGGTATCSLSYPGVGTHSVTAVYGGAGVFTGSTSPALSQVINAASTTTTLASSTNPSVTGQSVTFTATVAAAAPGSGTPTGTVAFQDGATTLSCTGGAQTLNGSGVATCQVPFSSAGGKSVVATYSGSTNYLTSSSASLSQNVNSASTTTTVSSSGLSSVTGQSVTYTASVAPVSPGAGTPAGTVAFKDGGTVISGCGAQTLSAGAATCVVTPSVGSHPITAVYAGTADFTTSTSSSITQVVSAASTTTSLTSAPNPSVTGQNVTFTATVTAVNPGTGTPTGTVSFTSGGLAITCTGGSQTLNGSGVATCQTTFSTSGTKSIVATYAGTTDYLGSASTAVSQVVNVPASATQFTVSPSPATVTAGSNLSLTITAKLADGTTTDTSYTGTKSLTWSGAATATSPSGVAPTLQASATFTSGVATNVLVTLTTAGASRTLTVSDGSISGQATVNVNNAAVSGLAYTNMVFGGSGSSVTACYTNCTIASLGNNGSVTANVSLVDAYGNLGSLGTDTTVSMSNPDGGTYSTTGTAPLKILAGTKTSTWTVKLAEGTASYNDRLIATSSPLSSSLTVTIKKGA